MTHDEFLQLEIPDAADKLRQIGDAATSEAWRAAYVRLHQVDPLDPKPHHAVVDPGIEPVRILSTLEQVPGRTIEAALGVVSSTVIFGADVFKDLGASIANTIGGRVEGYEKSANAARDAVIKAIGYQASRLGAHAVVGIRIDYSPIGVTNGMLMASATGTAVRLSA